MKQEVAMKKGKAAILSLALFLALVPCPAEAETSGNSYVAPGVYVEEISSGFPAITPVDTAVAGFLGQTEKGPLEPQLITSCEEFEDLYGGNPGNRYYLPDSVKGFFSNGGTRLYIARVVSSKPAPSSLKSAKQIKALPLPVLEDYLGKEQEDASTGLHALGQIDEITMLYSPEAQCTPGLGQAMIDQCEALHDRVAILESALGDTDPEPLEDYESSYACYYTPWLKTTDSTGSTRLVPPGGFIAGVFEKNDRERGIHKAPANIALIGVTGLERTIGSAEQSNLVQDRVNPVVSKAGRGILVYGARTLSTDPEYTYISIRRYLNYLNESFSECLEYLQMEYWNPQLNAQIKSSIEEFLLEEWHKGALLGSKQRDAYFVNVYLDPATPEEEGHRICVEVGVALLRPAEFHIVKTSVLAN